MKPILLFDVDGVIANTPHEKAWKLSAIEYGIISENYDFTTFYAKEVAGEPGIIGAYNILDKLGSKSYFEKNNVDENMKYNIANIFRSKIKSKYLENIIDNGNFELYYDIIDLIKDAKEKDYFIVAVSSSEYAKKVLDIKKIKNFFNQFSLDISSHWNRSIEKINHYAMSYGKALGKLGVDYSQVIVFEDAPKGIESVKKLGFDTIGISRLSDSGKLLSSKKDLYDVGADIVYSDNNIPLIDNIIKDLEKRK
jgi:beta-phosphoglucomutase